jgi:hypothetical protein
MKFSLAGLISAQYSLLPVCVQIAAQWCISHPSAAHRYDAAIHPHIHHYTNLPSSSPQSLLSVLTSFTSMLGCGRIAGKTVAGREIGRRMHLIHSRGVRILTWRCTVYLYSTLFITPPTAFSANPTRLPSYRHIGAIALVMAQVCSAGR